jgi:predicted esterase
MTKKTNELLYVLHGYGQLSQYFIRKFRQLHTESRIVIAPEGLSRFYLSGFDGRIGATWMTREDRENDILNYTTYLNSIHDSIKDMFYEKPKITVLGFSQGAATATRWLMDHHVQAERLLLWAGILPYDLNLEEAGERLGGLEKICVYGTEDPYLTDDKMKEMTDLSARTGLSFTYHSFRGGHDIDIDLLNRIMD